MGKIQYDVVVVGAGPAGSTAAFECSRAGLSTLLIERRHEIGVPVRCGEVIFRHELPDFLPLDPSLDPHEIKGLRIIAPSGDQLDIVRHHGAPLDCVSINRSVFDRRLAELAAGHGAEVRVKTRATGLVMEDGNVAGVRVRSFGQEEDIRAKIVIAADGVESQVGRWAGLKTGQDLSGLAVCAQYRMSGLGMDRQDYLYAFLGTGFLCEGGAWVIPRGSDLWNVGLGIWPHISRATKRESTAKDFLDAFVGERFPAAKQLGLVTGAVPVDGGLPRAISGAGIMVVGDAAHQVNPLTGAGITEGMRCAVIAAQTASEAFAKGDFSQAFLSKYDKRFRSELGNRWEALAHIKHIIAALDEERLNQVIRAANRGGASSVFELFRVGWEHFSSLSGVMGKIIMSRYFS
jgi:digeranylgeranylglycerophospholipid reductase